MFFPFLLVPNRTRPYSWTHHIFSLQDTEKSRKNSAGNFFMLSSFHNSRQYNISIGNRKRKVISGLIQLWTLGTKIPNCQARSDTGVIMAWLPWDKQCLWILGQLHWRNAPVTVSMDNVHGWEVIDPRWGLATIVLLNGHSVEFPFKYVYTLGVCCHHSWLYRLLSEVTS